MRKFCRRVAVRKTVCTGGSWNCTSVPKFCGGTGRKAEISNGMSDGTMEAPTRTGAKENGPTASSAPSATASAPARLRAVRRFMGAAESDG